MMVKVDTIDNYQGREKDYIVVDFVRAEGSFNEKSILSYGALKRNIDFCQHQKGPMWPFQDHENC